MQHDCRRPRPCRRRRHEHPTPWLSVIGYLCGSRTSTSLWAGFLPRVVRARHMFFSIRHSTALLVVLLIQTAQAALWEGFITTSTSPRCRYRDHKLWFCVHRPELLRVPGGPAPLVVVHGGPQVPSDYLFDLARLENRAVVFYDQLGAGRSDTPSADLGEVYSVHASMRDLRSVLQGLRLQQYHLYGQSWGGLLAAQLVGTESCILPSRTRLPRSLTLSNAPSSVALVEAEAGRLVDECGGDVAQFMAKHSCVIEPQPKLLADAYAHAGTTWRGSSVIAGVEVRAQTMAKVPCPVLCLRGENDFVTEACMQPWREGLPAGARFVTLADASHHALLEQPDAYLEALSAFLCEHDADLKQQVAKGCIKQLRPVRSRVPRMLMAHD